MEAKPHTLIAEMRENYNIMSTVIVEIEVEFKGDLFYADVEVEGELTDESFDHEFGTQEAWGEEVIGAKLLSCEDDEGNQVTDKEILDFVKKHIENEEFEDVGFDFSD